MARVLFTFDTTHHALWAEELARDHEIPHEVVPAPPAANAKCNLALETLPEWTEELARVLEGPPVPYRIFLDSGEQERRGHPRP